MCQNGPDDPTLICVDVHEPPGQAQGPGKRMSPLEYNRIYITEYKKLTTVPMQAPGPGRWPTHPDRHVPGRGRQSAPDMSHAY